MTKILQLNGKRILVTGGSSGIGAEASRVIGVLGGQPILVGRDRERLEKATNAAGSSRGAQACIADLSSELGIDQMLSAITIPLDGIVFSAGIAKHKPIHLSNLEYLSEIYNVNALIPQLILGRLIERKLLNTEASVVFISSISAVTGRRGTFAYSGSKGALLGCAKALADELMRRKIRVNVISPAIVETNIWTADQQGFLDEQRKSYPLGLPTVVSVAYVISFLLSKSSRLINGQNIVIDSGCRDIK